MKSHCSYKTFYFGMREPEVLTYISGGVLGLLASRLRPWEQRGWMHPAGDRDKRNSQRLRQTRWNISAVRHSFPGSSCEHQTVTTHGWRSWRKGHWKKDFYRINLNSAGPVIYWPTQLDMDPSSWLHVRPRVSFSRSETWAATCAWRSSTLCRGAPSAWRAAWRVVGRWAGVTDRSEFRGHHRHTASCSRCPAVAPHGKHRTWHQDFNGLMLIGSAAEQLL